MIFGSVCSGIEAASVAWHPLGWRAAFLSEIEAFPRAVLSHHYPATPLHGDFTTIQAGDYEPIDLLVGGTPCQSFSVAGLRGGMADERGNLALEYLRLADRLRPRWLVWENVPGVLSSNGGRDFGSFLGGLVKLGYGFAYRVLDAQFFGLAQRRKRVFVVGYFGDWRRAAAVLFEPASLRWNPTPSRTAGQKPARCLANGTGSSGQRSDGESEDFVVSPSLRAKANDSHRADSMAYIAHSLRSEGFDASEDGTGRGTPLIPCGVTIHGTDKTASVASLTDLAGALRARAPGGQENSSTTAVLTFDLAQITSPANRARIGPGVPASTLNAAGDIHVAFQWQASPSQGVSYDKCISPTLDKSKTVAVGSSYSAVRRLTPTECEKLQGFPLGYTDVPYRSKPAADGPRYRALGNSMAVPVMAWIGRRIDAQHRAILAAEQAAA